MPLESMHEVRDADDIQEAEVLRMFKACRLQAVEGKEDRAQGGQDG
jgi:hypothetical protein